MNERELDGYLGVEYFRQTECKGPEMLGYAWGGLKKNTEANVDGME